MNKLGRYYKQQRYYENDVYRKSTGVKKELQLCGNEDEIKVANQLAKFFKITFSKAGVFKTTSYVFNFLQPGEEFRDYYNLYNEVLLLFSPYTEFESRTLDFVDKTLEEFDNRLDKVCVFLISKDTNIESKINAINTSNKDSRIIVPFTYNEILHNGISKDDISGKLRKYFYNRDLFALESPLKTEAYFYGRNTLIQKLYDKYLMGEQSGLFGLRKTGKTSVLYALERQMILRSGYSIYIDCQNPSIYMLRWNELLKYIIDEIIKKYELDLIIDEDLYIEKKAAGSFEKYFKEINNKIGTRVLLMFDEIEHICFRTSDKKHWKSGEDYCMFWQTIRSVFQKEPECFTFLIAGVNPLCIETDYVNEIENPIFSMISSEYLSLFDLSNVKDMIGHIGKYMGLSFEEEIYTKLMEDYGGHPFLIRHICSLINTNVNDNRPCLVSKYEYDAKKKEYDTKIVHYVEMILSVLKIWYPSEYELLEILAVDGNDELKKNLEYKEKEMQHLLGYGIVKEIKGNYYITINAVSLYLENNHKLQGKQTTKQQAWSNVGIRRNTLEDRLRKIMLVQMTMQYGSKKVKGKLLEVVESSRREKERLHDLEVNDLVENHFYLLDIKQVILKNWSLFEKLFIDKVKFESLIDTINKYRIDAHAKTIDDSDMLMLMLAFNWFDERLELIPV